MNFLVMANVFCWFKEELNALTNFFLIQSGFTSFIVNIKLVYRKTKSYLIFVFLGRIFSIFFIELVC